MRHKRHLRQRHVGTASTHLIPSPRGLSARGNQSLTTSIHDEMDSSSHQNTMISKKGQHEGRALPVSARLVICVMCLAVAPSFAQDDAGVTTVTVTVTDAAAATAPPSLPTVWFVGGNLATQAAPYGLPSEDFLRAAVVKSDIGNRFSIPGYDICPGDDGGGGDVFSQVDGWDLKVNLARDVPLAGSTSLDLTQDMWITAATLSMTPSPWLNVRNFNGSIWRVSAVVFPDGIPEDRLSLLYQGDGTCDDALSLECIEQLQAGCSAAASNRGAWGDVQVPDSCKDYFSGTNGTSYGDVFPPPGLIHPWSPFYRRRELTIIAEINPIGQYSFLPSGQSPFFAAGLYPSSISGNETAVDIVKRRAWPVVITWVRLDGAGVAMDARSWVACPRAVDDSSKRVKPTSPATKTAPGRYTRVMYGAAAGALIAYLISLAVARENKEPSGRGVASRRHWLASWVDRWSASWAESLAGHLLRKGVDAAIRKARQKRRLEEETERRSRRRAHSQKRVHWWDQQDDSDEDWDAPTPVSEEADREYPDPPISVPSSLPVTPASSVDPHVNQKLEDIRSMLVVLVKDGPAGGEGRHLEGRDAANVAGKVSRNV
ncbi:hypothetical protein VTJ83DRAFT_34 [Remersonia thermophila]|uniref:Uncharacterized protein n=1 Tax=Remersonia thermophila TaxID=72144 RepID=A0ABR4DJZ3_9PEZI